MRPRRAVDEPGLFGRLQEHRPDSNTAGFVGGKSVLYHAAGGTGVGVLQAAYERGVFGIGVDARQSETLTEYNGAILGSMVKQVDEAVVTSVNNAINDEFRGGETVTLGIADEGVDLPYGTEIDDQIVMGSHGRSGVSRILLGSVAETVVRRSPVPVTVIR